MYFFGDGTRFGMFVTITAVVIAVHALAEATIKSPVLQGYIERDNWPLRSGVVLAAVAGLILVSFLAVPEHPRVFFLAAAVVSSAATLLIAASRMR